MLPNILLALLITSYASGQDNSGVPKKPSETAEFDDRDWDMSKIMGMSNKKENVVISPISLKVILGMLYEASRGQTSNEIAQFLHLNNTDKQKVRQRFAHLHDTLNEKSGSLTSSVGTRMYTHHSKGLNDTFLDIMKQYYGTEVKKVDFSKLSLVLKDINDWVKGVTEGHIQNLLSEGEVSPNALMLLLNVIYFTGKWKNPFNDNATEIGQFFLNEDESINAHMMVAEYQLNYAQSFDDALSIVQLPYEGSTFSMYILLPSSRTGVEEAVNVTSPQRIYSLMKAMQPTQVIVRLPRFDFTYSVEVKPLLEQQNVRMMFSNAADFSNLENGSSTLFVSDIIQKAGIQVNEKGTTAFAATVAQIENKFGGEKVVEFTANKPFVFFIKHDKTDTVVFVGKVLKPTVAPPPPPKVQNGNPNNQPLPNQIPQQQPQGAGNSNGVGLREGESGNSFPNLTEKFSTFDKELLEVVNSRKLEKNIVLAPASVKAILALLYHGATGETQYRIKEVLRVNDNNAIAEKQLAKMQKALKEVGKLSVKYANAIFVDKSVLIKTIFQRSAENDFNAPVKTVSFANPESTAQEINNWVSQQTEGLIPKIFEPEKIQKGTRMVLVNAMYFKGKWLNKFPKSDTRDVKFYLNNGQTVPVKMMSINGYFKESYEQELNAQIIQIPFQDPKFNLVVMLPTYPSNARKLVYDLSNYRRLIQTLNAQIPTEVDLSIPKFSIEFEMELSEPLSVMMNSSRLFSDAAELSNIANAEHFKVSTVVHKACIELDEDGAKAAAATGSSIVPLMVPSTEQFLVNRPFVYMIYNSVDHVILFEGVVYDPRNGASQTSETFYPTQPPRPPSTTRRPIPVQQQPNLKPSVHFPNPQQQSQSQSQSNAGTAVQQNPQLSTILTFSPDSKTQNHYGTPLNPSDDVQYKYPNTQSQYNAGNAIPNNYHTTFSHTNKPQTQQTTTLIYDNYYRGPFETQQQPAAQQQPATQPQPVAQHTYQYPPLNPQSQETTWQQSVVPTNNNEYNQVGNSNAEKLNTNASEQPASPTNAQLTQRG